MAALTHMIIIHVTNNCNSNCLSLAVDTFGFYTVEPQIRCTDIWLSVLVLVPADVMFHTTLSH